MLPRPLLAIVLLWCQPAFADVAEPASQADPQAQTDVTQTKAVTKSESRYPNLETGLLGELTEAAKKENRSWNRALPILAQKVIDMGFDLPNPYGLGLVYANIDQEIELSELEVGFNGGDIQAIDFVDFGKSKAENSAVQAKLDAWLFPFMNVYAVVGRFDGEAVIPIAVSGADALEFLLPDVSKLCARPVGFPGRPDLCDQLLTGTAFPKYEGTNIGIGMTLAMGWRNYFVAIPVTYIKTDINIVDSSIDTTQVAPRIGFTVDLDGPGMLAFYTGGSWIDIDLKLSGQVSLAVPGADPGDALTIDYTVREKNRDAWNYLTGVNWDVNANWSLQAEVGFGNTRNHLIGSLVYRW